MSDPAAARLQEAVANATRDFAPQDRQRLGTLEASTLHRLLGTRRDNGTRFRHHRSNRLPHDVIVVDETSMVSLTMMARLLEAVRPEARLILVGDPDQLASVEGLPKAYAGLQTLRLGLDHPVGAAGPSDPGGLLQGLQRIAAGLSNSRCNPANPTDPKNPCGVKETLASLDSGLTTIKGGLGQVGGEHLHLRVEVAGAGASAEHEGVVVDLGGTEGQFRDVVVRRHPVTPP